MWLTEFMRFSSSVKSHGITYRPQRIQLIWGVQGQNVINSQLWEKDPTWLSHPPKWPQDVLSSPTPESLAEAKTTQEILMTAMTENDALGHHLLDKYPLKTVLRIGAWVYHFIYNCQKRLEENSKDQSAHRKSSSRNCGGSNRPQRRQSTAHSFKQINSN